MMKSNKFQLSVQRHCTMTFQTFNCLRLNTVGELKKLFFARKNAFYPWKDLTKLMNAIKKIDKKSRYVPNVKKPLTKGPSTSPITTVKPVNSDLYLCTGIVPFANAVVICFNDVIFRNKPHKNRKFCDFLCTF